MSFLYREAGRVLQGVENGRASLKTLTLGRTTSVGGGKEGDQNGPKRKLYAMVSETLRYKPLLEKLVLMADPKGTLFCDDNMREKGQGYVMLYDMLLGKGSIQGGGKLKRHLVQYKVRLEECLVEAKLAQGLPADAANEALLPKSARRHIFPRYARVNLMTCPDGAKGVAATLRKEGFAVKIDEVVPSLLVLPAGTDLHDHPMVKDGRLVLQDKSSCFSAEALLGREASEANAGSGTRWKGGDVIDACAAPGNKTMHVASLLSQLAAAAGEGGGKTARDSKKRSSRVFAFDKDPRRLALMRRRVDEAGGGAAIETHLQDFLEVDAADERFSRVTAMLLDPSCSGSGIVSAPDRLHENQGVNGGGDGEEKSRVGRLAAFQLQGLLKAMSFPQVQRVCYSTCSIHVEENEAVVAKALKQQPTPPPPPLPPLSSSEHHAGIAVTPNPAPSPPSGNQKTTVVLATALAVPNTASSPTPDTSSVASDAGRGTSGGRFKLSRCLSRWPRRGLAVSGLDENQAACLVRTDPSEDETNGFFVAVFEREGGATKKKRNRHKNRKKNKKKRKREEAAEGLGDGVEGLGDVVAHNNEEVSGVGADNGELGLGLTVRVETNGGEGTTKS